jgi:hypothetical protein
MRNLNHLALLAIVLMTTTSLVAEDANKLPAESGLKPIFNGKDLTGWDGDPRLWSVKDGVIHGQTTKEKPAKGNTFLIWKAGKTGDFELRLSFRCNATNNSGIQYRSKHITTKARNKWVVRGYQHEIRNQNKLPSVSGFIYAEGGKRGRMALIGDKTTWGKDGKKTLASDKLITAAEYEKLFKLDKWNEVVIIAKGTHLRHYMNGRLVMDCVDNHPSLAHATGILAFQLHAGKPMFAEFKDVRIKELK